MTAKQLQNMNKTEIKLNKVMATLDYLMSEHNDSIQFYISLSKKEKE